MKKKVLATLVVLSLSTSVGLASPLTDYSAGKVAVDVSVRSSNDISTAYATIDGKTANVGYGVTFGLGNNWAFQYKQDNADSKNLSPAFGFTEHVELQSNQYNVLYKIAPNASAFVGLVNTKANEKTNYGNVDGKNVTGYQVGLVGSVLIANKLNAYASLGYGDKIEDYEFGLGYGVAKNLELNVGYKDTKYKKLKFQDIDGDRYYKANGLVYGVTYKF